MSETVQDHPDIEKLPLEVDGVAVREVVRAVFRDSANGTPDNISKAGCLALADLDYRVWNAWREMFPVNGATNRADFSGCIFHGRLISFERMKFGEKATFEGALFSFRESFQYAEFGDRANFAGAQFANDASFRNARFEGDVDFYGLQWGHLTNIYSDGLDAAQALAIKLGTSPGSFMRIDFVNCHFGGEIFFSDREFKRETSFEKCTFEKAPKFHGCQLHQNTSFEGTKFPYATGSVDAARAYRTLKLAFSKQQAIREEQRFFRLEMAEETRGSKWYEKPYYYSYKCLSNYGHSVFRPFLFLLVVTLISAGLYAEPCEEVCLLISSHCSTNWDLIGKSLFQSVPLGGLVELKDNTYGFLRSSGIVLHRAASLLALFLMGLALRNLFKLK